MSNPVFDIDICSNSMNTKFSGKKFHIILGILFFAVSSSLFSQIDSQQGKSKIKWVDVTVLASKKHAVQLNIKLGEILDVDLPVNNAELKSNVNTPHQYA
jgi:hypothetical protein